MVFFRERKRNQLRAEPLPGSWHDVLRTQMAYYRLLDDREQHALHGHMHILVAEKRFVGCNGLELTEAMTVLIAAHAALLMLERDLRYFPRLGSVLVYPTHFVTTRHTHTEWGLVEEEEVVETGESWNIGAVVLSWPEVLRDAARIGANNVVLHEFAHQIDQDDGAADGWPAHMERELQADWQTVMREEYLNLVNRVEEGRRTIIDPYGATNPAEFFAVVTEAFFVQPLSLREHHADLYGLLKAFYRQDPALRFEHTT